MAVTLGSVEAAVREDGARVETLARGAGGVVTPAPPDFWARYDRSVAPGEGEVLLHVSSLASHLGATVAALEGAVERVGHGASVLVSGGALFGTLRALITGADGDALAPIVDALRDVVGPLGGSVVVQGPRAARECVDPWGPVAPDVLDVMREIKATFDPTRVLNPGRFVGGL
jgi:glycolate oxidase FAD binding subunit